MLSFFRTIFILLVALSASAFALDRNAFTFTKYDLELRVDPEEQALASRGKITLRNDSDKPQTTLVLQVSSALEFRMIELNGKPLQYLSEPLTTDIDHTGKVTEAVVTLPTAVPPNGSVELEIGYSGTIPKDSTRLTKREVPEAQAFASDWDRVSAGFTGVRGVGHVVWYPISTPPANLSDNTLFSTIAQWQARQSETRMTSRVCWITDEDRSYEVVSNGAFEGIGGGTGGGEGNRTGCTSFSFPHLERTIPTFAIAPFDMITKPSVSIYSLSGHDQQAAEYAAAAERVQSQVEEWFGKPSEKIQVIELPEAEDASFDSGTTLFTPLNTRDKRQAESAMAHQLTHAAFPMARPWIAEGLASFAQLLLRESTDGRKAALDYLTANLPALVAAEKENGAAAKPSGDAGQSLLATSDDIYLREKAMYVWSMLRDMIGETAFKAVLKSYRAADDTTPTYLQKLVAAQSKRDLEWFFDDWVYRDRGLPEFKIESAVPRETLNNSYVVAVTVANAGAAGAEIPITVRGPNGEQTLRTLVPAHQKVTTRVSLPAKPTEVVLNDGSVPESDSSNDRMELK
jgi:hypothetical protein